MKTLNLEKAGWLFMRFSGALLIVLIFTHLGVNLLSDGGVKAIDFAFVAGKLANPFWQVFDTLLLWLALIHGANGMRTVINDYATKAGVRKVLLGALGVSTAMLIIMGTLVIYTLDPCPAGTPADLLPSFCPVV